MRDSQAAVSVSELNRYIKRRLDEDSILSSVWVKGELSNFVNHYKTGHYYMSLKDEKSVIRAVMFASAAVKVPFKPESGMKVICRGRVAVFERDGQYQLYIEEMLPDGVGSLYIAYEQLKKKLEEEGIFDASTKKRLPAIPLRVGIITSPTGAAVRDIINVCGRRFPLAALYLYPVLVQGEGAPAQLIEALSFFNKHKAADVIIIGRGGGSIEELWAFNDEALARAVAASSIPVISAVGHETDFTICDFAADLRAPTPSAAAEICVPDSQELAGKFSNLEHKITILALNLVKSKRQRFLALKERRALTAPEEIIYDRQIIVGQLSRRLESSLSLIVQKKHRLLTAACSKLEALSPLAVLSRGYAYATRDGLLLKTAAGINKGELLCVAFADGEIEARAEKITLKEKKDA